MRDTLKLPRKSVETRRESLESEQRQAAFKRLPRPYVDRGLAFPRYQRGGGLRVKDPPPVLRVTLTIEQLLYARRRHNSLQPELMPIDRMLLRWGEAGGTGLPNPEAEVRETHYDPLPPDLQQRVDDIVASSPWETLTRRWYRTSLSVKALADELCVSRKQLYIDWGASLWYYRGRFESESVHE